MKIKILATASVIALMASLPALAETAVKTQTEINSERSTSGDFSKDAKAAWKDVKKDASEAYEEIKATLIGDETEGKSTIVVLDSRKTATGIIGHPVHNEKHESIAKVTDIILDQDGKAVMVIVADGEFIGMGKKAAFDYSAITRVEKDGDVIMPLTEKMIDTAAAFSYEKADARDKVHVIPDNGYSVAKILGGQLVNQKQEPVATIDNIFFKNGRANQIIIGFDKMLGMGGKRAALDYADAKLIRNGDDLNFQLSDKRAAQFESYKKSATN
jgi:uncharacterized protein YrrD